MKSDRIPSAHSHPIPQIRPVEPCQPLSANQHILYGVGLVLMLLVLLILAWSVRSWQQDITTQTTTNSPTVSEPTRQSLPLSAITSIIPEQAAARAGHLIVGVSASIERINPLYCVGAAEQDAVSLIFESLVSLDESGVIVPELAKDYRYDPADQLMVFNLRSDHYFRDGRPVDARDVAWTYQLLLAPSYDGQLQGYCEQILSVDVNPDDPSQVIFHLADSVETPDLRWFTIGIMKMDAYPIDPAQVYALGLDTPLPEGSGPYELRELTDGAASLGLRTGFAGAITEIEFRPVDSAQLFDLLEAGELDLAYGHWDARLKQRLDTLPAYDFFPFEVPAGFLMVNRTPGGSQTLTKPSQQDAVLRILTETAPTETIPADLDSLQSVAIACFYYRGFDQAGQADNLQLAKRALEPLIQLGIQIDFEPVDWPELASRAVEGRYDLIVLPTPANEYLPANTRLLGDQDSGAAFSLANTAVAATTTEVLLFSRRLAQITLNPFSRPLSVHPFSWTDRTENIRLISKEATP